MQQAYVLWLGERLAWQRAHGWPGDLTAVDLIRQSVNSRRMAHGVPPIRYRRLRGATGRENLHD